MRRIAAFLCGVLVGTCSLGASAAPTVKQRAQADSLFRDAKRLAQEGKVTEACPKFAASHRIDPQLGTLLYLATCYEQEGKTASAWMEFNAAAAMADKAEDPRAKLARERAEALDGKLSRVTIRITERVAGIEVRLDGELIDKASVGVAVPVDPGDHELSVSATGHTTWSETFTAEVGPAEQERIVPALVVAAVSAPVEPEPETPRAAEGFSSQQIAGIVVGGAGVIGVGIGAALGVVAKGQYDEAEASCTGSTCPQAALDQHDEARTSALGSTLAFAIGGAAMATGIVLLVTAPGAGDQARYWLAPQIGGVTLRGRW